MFSSPLRIATCAVLLAAYSGPSCRAESGSESGESDAPAAEETGLLASYSTAWEKCVEKRIFGKKIKGCVRILEEGDSFYVELQIGRYSKKWEIAEKCYESDKIGFGIVEGWIKVCLSDPHIEGGELKSVRVKVELCAKLAGRTECKKVYDETVRFLRTRESCYGAAVGAYGYVEDED